MKTSSLAEPYFLKGEEFVLLSLPNNYSSSSTPLLFKPTVDGILQTSEGHTWHTQPFENSKNFLVSQSATTKEQHRISVEKALSDIKTGRLQKVVVSRLLHSSLSIPPAEVYDKLCSLYPGAFKYWFHSKQFGTWMGASPELLLERNGLQYKTTALAGTLPADSSDQKQEWRNKEKFEQEVVTKFIVDQIKNVGIDQIETNGPYEQLAGSIKHLKTDIQFSSSKAASQILHVLQPTPAVCGLPREVAKGFILENESHERRLYSGYLGFSSEEDGDIYFVNLRCMQIFTSHVEIFVGGGIVEGSNPDSEWLETEMKSQTLLRAIQP